VSLLGDPRTISGRMPSRDLHVVVVLSDLVDPPAEGPAGKTFLLATYLLIMPLRTCRLYGHCYSGCAILRGSQR